RCIPSDAATPAVPATCKSFRLEIVLPMHGPFRRCGERPYTATFAGPLQRRFAPSVQLQRAAEAGVGRRKSPPVRTGSDGRPGGGQRSLRSFHFSQIFRDRCSAVCTAASGVATPVAAEANRVFSTQVPYRSSIAAVV